MGTGASGQQVLATVGEANAGRALPFGRPMLFDEERAAVAEVLEGPILTHGPRVRAFEEAFAAFTGAPHAIATASCTASLHLAFLYLGLRPGDEVIVPALSHVATAHAVELAGGHCVFVDAEPATGNIDVGRIEEHVTERTRAIVVVHFLGLPVDMAAVNEIARKHDLFVIEDCALALGALYRGVHVGLWGDVGCFSFYPVKHITTGEGGMTITRRGEVAAMAGRQRAFGIDRHRVEDRTLPGLYDVDSLGGNFRMTEMAAALGCEQMRRLPQFLARRRANERTLREGLGDLEGVTTLRPAYGPFQSACYAHCLVLEAPLAERRDELISDLRSQSIGTSVYYPRPIPLLSWYRDRYGHTATDFPHALRISKASIALPVGPHLTDDDMRFIAASVREGSERLLG